MNRTIKLLFISLMVAIMPIKLWAQQPYRQYADNGILLDFHEIDNMDFRVFLLYNLEQDDRFILNANDEPGQFSIILDENDGTTSFYEAFDAFYNNTYTDYLLLTKMDKADLLPIWKDSIEPSHFVSITLDIAISSHRNNNRCANSNPFCTSDVITFNAATNPGYITANALEGTTIEDGCIGQSYNPSWYHMRIQTAGQFVIHMEGHDPDYPSIERDVDFCIWGPFTDPISPCVAQLTANKIVDCSYSASYTEDIYLGYPEGQHDHGLFGDHGTVHYHVPQVGEYYILMITNYSNFPCVISFTKSQGIGETDCGILPGTVENDGPYCVGETINLTVNGQNGATYSWSGPGGFTSNQQNPSRPNCTMNMAGTYTCTTSVGAQTSTGTTDVVIYPQPTASFTATTVCQGTPTQFTSNSTTNPAGQNITSYLWNFGDGSTSTQQNPSHNYNSPGTFPVTLTVSCGNGTCSNSTTQNVIVQPAPVANAGNDQYINYGGTAQLHGSGGNGSFNFHWEPANMVLNPNSQNTQTISLTADQTYTLTVTNAQGDCVDTDQTTIHISGSAMAVTAGPNVNICQGGSSNIYVTAGGGTGTFTYSWSPTTGLSNPRIANPIASPSQTTTYTCTVSDGTTSQQVHVTVNVNDIIVENEYAQICPNDIYPWNGTTYTIPGVYQFNTVTPQGCDAIYYLHLSHYDSYDETTITAEICAGESYDFHGTSFTSSITNYPHTLHTANGCDSIIRLNLTVWPENDLTIKDVSICPGQLPYVFYGQDYYEATEVIIADTDMHGCDSVVWLILNISDYYIPEVEQRFICYEDTPSYIWNPTGNHPITLNEEGFYIDTLPAASCEGIYRLDLHFQQVPEVEHLFETACDSYDWIVDGVKVGSYNASGAYSYSVPIYQNPSNPNTLFPCNRDYQLHLTLNHSDLHGADITIDDACNSYTWQFGWDGESYTYEQDVIDTKTIETQHGCDSTITLTIRNMKYTPVPEINCADQSIEAPHYPITATEFNVNRYTYYASDPKSESTWHNEQCEWTISKDSWRIIPSSDNHACTVYVMDWVSDTVWLTFKAVNACSDEDGVIARYWLKPSFYGVNEQEAYPAEVSIIPNPNNGQMEMRFDNMEGKVNVKVFTIEGALVDQFEVQAEKNPFTHNYSTKRLNNGVYLFVFSDGKRSTTNKVIIIH